MTFESYSKFINLTHIIKTFGILYFTVNGYLKSSSSASLKERKARWPSTRSIGGSMMSVWIAGQVISGLEWSATPKAQVISGQVAPYGHDHIASITCP